MATENRPPTEAAQVSQYQSLAIPSDNKRFVMHHRVRYLIQRCSIVIFSLLASTAWANSLTVTSPDGHTTVTVTTLDGKPVYRVDRHGKPVLNDSRLGLE